MTMNEILQRLLSNALIPAVSLVFGGLWFSLSVLAHVVAIFLPPAPEHPLSSAIPPRRSNGKSARHPARHASAPLPSILSSKRDTPLQHVRFPKSLIESNYRPSTIKRWSSPADLSMTPPPVLPDEMPEVVAVKESESQAEPRAAHPLSSSKLPRQDIVSQASSPSPSLNGDGADSILSGNSSESIMRRTSITRRLPSMNVFRNRSKRVKSEGGHSRSSSICSSVASSPPSTPSIMELELTADPEHGPTSAVSSAETLARGFAQTFKFRPKRSSASATMSASTDTSSSVVVRQAMADFHQTPSPPPSPDHKTSATRSRSQSRRKAFASYLNLSDQTHHQHGTSGDPNTASLDKDVPTTSHRSIFSPVTPKSLCMKKQQAKKTPPGPVPRTQPYGPPYYAVMPNGEYAVLPPLQRQRRSARSRSRKSSIDKEKSLIEQAETSSSATSANTLGLELGRSDTTRNSRRRQVVTAS